MKLIELIRLVDYRYTEIKVMKNDGSLVKAGDRNKFIDLETYGHINGVIYEITSVTVADNELKIWVEEAEDYVTSELSVKLQKVGN